MRRGRCLTSILLTLSILMGYISASAGSVVATGYNSKLLADEEPVITDTDSSDEDYDENDYLAEEYIARELADMSQIANCSYNYRSLLSGNELYIYDVLYSTVKDIVNGKRLSTVVNITVTDLPKHSFTADELGVDSLLTEYGSLNQEAKYSAVHSLSSINLQRIIRILMFSCPYEMYWYDKQVGASAPPISYFCKVENGELTVEGTYVFSFPVCSEYQGDDVYSLNPVFPTSINNAKRNIQSIIDRYSVLNDVDKLIAYKDEICNLVSYNHEAAESQNKTYGNPWQLIWVFDGDYSTNVVCEGYSKAFQYLCDKSVFNGNVYVYCVSGWTSGPHMWNIIHMENGKNYLADLTNCDSGRADYSKKLFLAGYSSQSTVPVHYTNGTTGELWGYTFSCGVSYYYTDVSTSTYTTSDLILSNSDYLVENSSDTNDITLDPTVTVRVTSKPTVAPTVIVTRVPTVTTRPSSTSDETQGVGGFVERLYTVALGRVSDPLGKTDWINRVKTQGYTGADLARGFLFSQEFLGKNLTNSDFLDVLYRTFFDREADCGGKNNWMSLLERGWSKTDVIDGFINSIEWANLCLVYGIPSGSSAMPNINIEPSDNVVEFVERLYIYCLDRRPDSEGLYNWARMLANQQISGTEVAYGFFFSDEFINSCLPDDLYISRLYKTFLNRSYDTDGILYWLNKLDSGYTRRMVFDGFANSVEFSQLCAEYGIIR